MSFLYPNSITFKEIEDIYFFEANTKYISSNMMKISVNFRVRNTSDISDIFNTEMKYFWYLPKKGKFSFYFFSPGELKRKAHQN